MARSKHPDLSKYVSLPGDPEPQPIEEPKSKRVAPRDRYEQRRYTAAELDAFKEARAREAAIYSHHPPPMENGHSLRLEIVGATIVKGEIRVSLIAHGAVQRPEGMASAKGVTQEITIPAIYSAEP